MQLAPLPNRLPPLPGGQLRVRRLKQDDLGALVTVRSHPDVARYQSWDESWGIDDARMLFERDQQLDVITPGSWVQWALEDAASGAVCGDLGLHFVDHAPRTVELGVTVGQAHQRRGLAHEALSVVLRWLLTEHNLHRAYAQLDERNVAVRALFAKLGFRQEAAHKDADWFKGEWTTLVVMAALRDELMPLVSAA